MKTKKVTKKYGEIEESLRESCEATVLGLLQQATQNFQIKDEVSIIEELENLPLNHGIFEYQKLMIRIFEDVDGVEIRDCTVEDANHNVLELLPMPGPFVEVTKHNVMLRYRIFWLLGPYTLQTNLVRVGRLDEERLFKFVNLSKAETKIVKMMAKTLNPTLVRFPMRLELSDQSDAHRAANSANCDEIELERSRQIMQDLNHCEQMFFTASLIANVYGSLADRERPYFLFAFELDAEDVEEEREMRRKMENMALILSFNHNPGVPPVFPTAVNLNDAKAAQLLRSLSGVVPVAHVYGASSALRDITNELAAARMSLIQGLPSGHPLTCCPIVAGKNFSDALLCTTEWETPRFLGNKTVAELRRTMAYLLREEEQLLEAFRERYVKIAEAPLSYEAAYIHCWWDAINAVLGVEQPAQATPMLGIPARQAEREAKRESFDKAVDKLCDFRAYPHLIAMTSRELLDDQACFFYTRKGKNKIAFSSDAFRAFAVETLGVSASDEPEFRRLLRDRYRLITEPQLTTTIVGRGGENAAHVLIDVAACDNYLKTRQLLEENRDDF